PVGRDRPHRRGRPGRRPGGRRVGQVAGGRGRHRLPVTPPRGGRRAAAGGHARWPPGGTGPASLSARPEVAAGLAPRLVGWFGHQAPFAFEPSPIAYAEGAGRVVTGTPNRDAPLT